MKFLTLSLALVLVAPFAQAAPPSPVSPSRYSSLWNNSPFTTKPVTGPVMETNPFEDYALGGVTPLDGGDYIVTLLNKKKPEERVRIPGNDLGFKLLEVRKGSKGPLSTTVMISNGVKSGLVSFDDKLLVLKPPVAAKAQPGQAPNGQGQPLQPGQLANNGQPTVAPQIQPPNGVPQNPGIRPTMPNAPGTTNGQSTTGGQGRPPRPRVVPVPPTTTR